MTEKNRCDFHVIELKKFSVVGAYSTYNMKSEFGTIE